MKPLCIIWINDVNLQRKTVADVVVILCSAVYIVGVMCGAIVLFHDRNSPEAHFINAIQIGNFALL